MEMPKIQPEWYGPGEVHLDMEDRLICVAPDGGLISWRSGDLPDLETLYNSAMQDAPDAFPKQLPGSWDVLPSPKFKSLQLSAHSSWGVGVDGSLHYRRAHSPMQRNEWTSVRPPSVDLAGLMPTDSGLDQVPCPSMPLDEYFALGQARIHVNRALRKLRLESAQRKAKSVEGASVVGTAVSQSVSVSPSPLASNTASGLPSAAVSAAVSPRGTSPVLSDVEEQQGDPPGLEAETRPRRSGSVVSELSMHASVGDDDALPELPLTPSNLTAHATQISTNTDNSYVICIDKAGQMWGRLGMAPSLPQGRYWIR